ALVADAQQPESKARLRRQTDDAIARGVFGVPSMEVGDELFWGYDDFPYLELFLAGRDPLDATQRQTWFGAARPSAVRRRFRSRARRGRAAARIQGAPSPADGRRDCPRRVRRALDGGRGRAVLGLRRFPLPRALSRRQRSARRDAAADVVRCSSSVGGSQEVPISRSSRTRSSPNPRRAFAGRRTTRLPEACSACPRWRSGTSCSGATTISPTSSSFSPAEIRSTRRSGRRGSVQLVRRRFAGGSDLALVADAQQPESKARLRRQTDDAIARGVFGVPSMEVGDELFWGYDDFPYLELFLAGRDPLDATQRQTWFGAARPSAVRRRFRPRDEGA